MNTNIIFLGFLIVFSAFCHGEYGGDQLNIYDKPLEICSTDPMTGWFRDGYARTDSKDHGTHVVCATMTDAFLEYTKRKGNDLSTPTKTFPGLKAGDRWALCVVRWKQILDAANSTEVDPSVKIDAVPLVKLN